ncbi:AAA family ATPase, partial [Streptomyces sp. NPDC059082]|uniref:AAA family ATPase n=1 Tax=Streptomyces sp. NPDC059082 TaxID=3346720 RepID=UPI00368D8E99
MRRSNLPAELNRFVGRTAERAALTALLETSRLVTVVGVGGVGKTRLALRAAAEAQKRFGEEVRLADLTPLRDPGLVAHALAEALGLTDHTPRPPRAGGGWGACPPRWRGRGGGGVGSVR